MNYDDGRQCLTIGLAAYRWAAAVRQSDLRETVPHVRKSPYKTEPRQVIQMLHSGNGIPLLGFGTYPLTGEEVERCIGMALEVGFRHFDTAQMYGNERDVGRALKASGLRRDEFYVVTKVDPGNLGAGRFRASVERSTADLNGPVDLLLIHWPPPEPEFDATIDRLVAAQLDGFAKAIGVSNFPVALMRRPAPPPAVPLIANQVEFHPLIDQSTVLAEARRLHMTLSAYRPLGRGAVLQEEVVEKIAARHGQPASAVVVRWIIQQGVAAIPMTAKRLHAESNFKALSFTLTDDDVAAISSLNRRNRRLVSPSWMTAQWDD
jgi:diketogulonate reductase-like aldo/keto reductase